MIGPALLEDTFMLMRSLAAGVVTLIVLSAVGCRDGLPPRLRPGCYPTSTIGAPFVNPEKLGRHGYRFSLSEKNGIVYTCRGGAHRSGPLADRRRLDALFDEEIVSPPDGR